MAVSAGLPPYELRLGNAGLLVSIPHAGTYLPPHIAARLTPVGRAVVDTDWHVDLLYAFLAELDVTTLVATHSRVAVDVNRSLSGGRLYPGHAETSVCPTETFDGQPLYERDMPDAAEIAQRGELYWRPYHAALAAQIARLRAMHGAVRVLDAHSIRGVIPRLFDGELPALNFGTHDGAACDPALAQHVLRAAGDRFSKVLNGRFKGGYITRHYGQPAQGVNVIQLELAQRIYTDESSPEIWRPMAAASLIEVLRNIVTAILHVPFHTSP